MTRRRPQSRSGGEARRSALLALAIVAASIGGCSGHDDPGTSRSSEPAGTADSDGHRPAPATSPLDELLGVITDPGRLSEAFAKYNAGYPAEMTRCVRDRGYPEFTAPVEPTPTPEELSVSVDPADLSTLPEHGYAIAENLGYQIDSAARDDSTEEIPRWVSAMTPNERNALLAEETVCQKLAMAKFPHPLVLNITADAFMEIQAIRRTIEGSPEPTAIWNEWAECMRARGYSAARRTDLIEELEARATAVSGQLETAQRQTTGRLPADSPAIAAARRDTDAIAAREAEVVADDLACAEPMHLEERLRDTQLRLERDYVDEHGAELRQMLAAASTEQAAG